MNNALNANIPNITVSPFASGTFNMFVEDCNISINVIYKALPIIVKIIDLVIILAFLFTGFLSSTCFLTGSRPKASAGGPSIIILTHSNCIVVKGISWPTTCEIIATKNAIILTVSWNWTNLWKLSYIPLPHLIPLTIVENESSVSIMSAAFLETSVPDIPIAIPTSAFDNAGASFIPSPVTATTSPSACSACTILILLSGLLLATIDIVLISSLNSSSVKVSIYDASTALILFLRRPKSSPIALAVFMLSPVSIFTDTPAWCAVSTACLTSGLSGSLIPTNPPNTKLSSHFSMLISSSSRATAASCDSS